MPEAEWPQKQPSVSGFLQFGQHGHVTNVKERKPKLEDRAALARYLRRAGSRHCEMLSLKANKRQKCRIASFKPHYPSQDPAQTNPPMPQASQAQITSRKTQPKARKQALKGNEAPQWRESWSAELDKLETKGAIKWQHPSHMPPEAKTLPVKINLTIKKDENGAVAERKARCALRGDLQKPGMHCNPDHISSQAADRDTIRAALAQAAAKGRIAEHLDIESAFLHEKLDPSASIWAHQPPRFDGERKCPGYIGKVEGNMHGAKQACEICAAGLTKRLASHGFTRLQADTSACILTEPGATNFALLTATVGDFLATSSHRPMLERAKKMPRSKCNLKDLGPVKHILKWKVDRAPDHIKISQPAFITQTLEARGMADCKPSPTPCSAGLEITKATGAEEQLPATDIDRCRSIIGSLRCLADSARPDISCITGCLARHIANPCARRKKAVTRMLRCLQGAKTCGIARASDGNDEMAAHSGSDFASDPDTRRSTAGSIFHLHGGPISWRSARQGSAALSAADAECIAASAATQRAGWLRRLLAEIGSPQRDPTAMNVGSQAALKIAQAPGKTRKSKHIEVKRHFIKDKQKGQTTQAQRMPSSDMKAGFLTKQLKTTKCKRSLQLNSISDNMPRSGEAVAR